jgi:hypothetical protein
MGHPECVPDDEDYATLDRLLRDPNNWTPDDLRTAEVLLAAQLEVARTSDQGDRQRVKAMQAVAEQLASAIEEHRTSS